MDETVMKTSKWSRSPTEVPTRPSGAGGIHLLSQRT